jgi:hypothetical protein
VVLPRKNGPTESDTAAGIGHMTKLSKRVINQAEVGKKDYFT